MKCKKIYSRQSRRLFLYNTCLVVCGISMAMTNYFQPLMAAMASYNCSSVTNLTSVSSTPLLDSSPDIPWACDPYNGQLMYAFLYGITSAAYVLLTTLVLADLLGADKFTNAFGLLLLFQGVATFIGPPVVGRSLTIKLNQATSSF